MKISATYILIDKAVCFDDVKRYVRHVSPQRQEQIARYQLDRDKITCLTAELLIRRQASQHLGVRSGELIIACHELGKPYLPDYPEYHFSVSHSDRCVAFASGGTPVGVDVERVSDPDPAIVEACFAPGERHCFLRSGSQRMAFYDIWTKKESYIKMLGTGFSTPLLSFDVTDEALKKRFRSQHCFGYWISVCSRSLQDHAPVFERLALEELLDFFR